MKFNILYFLALCFAVAHLFFYQIQKLNINSEHSCLNIFKSNNILGLIIYISLLTGKIFYMIKTYPSSKDFIKIIQRNL